MGVSSNMREHHKDQLIEVLMYYCSQDARRRLMDECPAAYNAYCGREVVQVFIASDISDKDQPNVPVTPAATYTERYRAALAKREV